MAQKNLLTPPSNLRPPAVLALSQKAPRILAKSPTSSLPWPVNLLFSTETPESWTIHENLFLSSLRAGDDASARKILDRLTARFGEKNERIVTLRGIYEESQATSPAELDKVFEGYEKILREDPTNVSIRKRRVVILKNLGRINDAITAITMLLQHSPTDTEAWAEASELYAMQGAWGQAIFCMEEVLLAMPNAWSAHAQLATLHYLSSASSPNIPSLALALRSFSRSVELNESYLRGYYGLKFVTQKLIPLLETAATSSSKRGNADDDDVPVPQLATVKKLEEIATTKLAEIIRNYSTGKKGWTAFDEAEVIAARELLDRDSKVER